MELLKKHWGAIIFYLTIIIFILCLGTESVCNPRESRNPVQNDVIALNK